MTGTLNKCLSERELKSLPRGRSVFSEIRANGQIYVDKTALIYKLACGNDQYFLSRPRRFGKTLLINTFESLFQYGLRDFKGLAIEKLWEDTVYEVMHLNLAEVSLLSLDEFRNRFYEQLNEFMLLHPVKEDAALSGATSFMGRFSRYLKLKPDNSIVLLIDEYDNPLTHCMDDPDMFRKVSLVLNEFYEIIKNNTDKFRFMFVTGICKFKNLSLFSGPNHIADISMYSEFGELLGYTTAELERYFAPFIGNAAAHLGISYDECLSHMKFNYDGFCFDDKAQTHVFCPWSVLNFLKFPEEGLRDYWYDSAGSSTVLVNYLKQNGIRKPEIYGQDLTVSPSTLDTTEELSTINDVALLFHTGYLTIKDLDEFYGDLVLNYPNHEVEGALVKLYTEQSFNKEKFKTFTRILLEGDPQSIIDELNRYFTSLDYNDFKLNDEASVRSVLQLCLMISGLHPKVEVHNHRGRSDLEVKADKRYFVFELKYHREGHGTPEKLLEEAVAQMTANHYGEQNCPDLPHIRIALVFSRQERRFTLSKFF